MNCRRPFLLGIVVGAVLFAGACGRASLPLTPPPAALTTPPPTLLFPTAAPSLPAPPAAAATVPLTATTKSPPPATARPASTTALATSTSSSPATARPLSTPAPTAAPILKVETLVTGLEAPWALDFAPDGRIFVTERGGRIRIIAGGKLLPQPWMVLDVAATGEAGLLGLALDPDFAHNRFVYVAYTTRVGARLQNRLVRLREDPATGQGVLDRVLLEGIAGNIYHDGGRVKFGPDGKLYWTMGDAQNSAAAQDLTSLSGKILRLNPDGTIPADNPFPGSPVYSYGHRNPQGLAWQPPTSYLATNGLSGGRPADRLLEPGARLAGQPPTSYLATNGLSGGRPADRLLEPGARLAGQPGTGRLYATEHGPTAPPTCCRDELNLIEPGKNYGWPLITGDQTRPGLESPVLQSGNTVTWAPSGATFVTKGPWAGSLLFAGLRGESLYRVVLDPADPRRVVLFEGLLAHQYGRLRDVVQGPDGALYVLTSNLDGRGVPPPDGDRVLRLGFTTP